MPVCEVHHMEAITPPIFGLENKTPKFRIIILKICSNHKNSADILIRGEWRDAQTFMDVQTVLSGGRPLKDNLIQLIFFFFFFCTSSRVYEVCVWNKRSVWASRSYIQTHSPVSSRLLDKKKTSAGQYWREDHTIRRQEHGRELDFTQRLDCIIQIN